MRTKLDATGGGHDRNHTFAKYWRRHPKLVLVAGLMLGAGAAQASHGVLNPVSGEFIALAGQTIDCGEEGVGIHLSGISDVHINGGETGTVTNCTDAIRIDGGGGNHINAVLVENNTCGGIVLANSSHNHVNGNIIRHNGCAGIKLSRGGQNHINGKDHNGQSHWGINGSFYGRYP